LPPSAVSDEVDEVMKVLGLLASTATASLALESQEYHNEESQLDISQMRIYIVPVLEYVLAADPLGKMLSKSLPFTHVIQRIQVCGMS